MNRNITDTEVEVSTYDLMEADLSTLFNVLIVLGRTGGDKTF